jgi:serine phosphatase RsbU (regulator of sigma subunit)
VLGMFRTWNGEAHRVWIGRGDTLALFTDGVTEAGVEVDREYGEERLIAMLGVLRSESVERTLDRIVDSVKSFSGTYQSDDITLILLKGR